jgi:drug/metabolite transporter (DMT)-like permease
MTAPAAAACVALGTVLQQKGRCSPRPMGDPGFPLQIRRRPVWLAGGLLQAGGRILQAAAPDRGPLVVVQPICTLSPVFALPLARRIPTRRWVGPR